MKISTGLITSFILGLVMLMVLFKVMPTVIPSAALAVTDLFSATNLANATVVGAGPAALAAQLPGLIGYFWVVIPFALAVAFIVSLKRGR